MLKMILGFNGKLTIEEMWNLFRVETNQTCLCLTIEQLQWSQQIQYLVYFKGKEKASCLNTPKIQMYILGAIYIF